MAKVNVELNVKQIIKDVCARILAVYNDPSHLWKPDDKLSLTHESFSDLSQNGDVSARIRFAADEVLNNLLGNTPLYDTDKGTNKILTDIRYKYKWSEKDNTVTIVLVQSSFDYLVDNPKMSLEYVSDGVITGIDSDKFEDLHKKMKKDLSISYEVAGCTHRVLIVCKEYESNTTRHAHYDNLQDDRLTTKFTALPCLKVAIAHALECTIAAQIEAGTLLNTDSKSKIKHFLTLEQMQNLAAGKDVVVNNKGKVKMTKNPLPSGSVADSVTTSHTLAQGGALDERQNKEKDTTLTGVGGDTTTVESATKNSDNKSSFDEKDNSDKTSVTHDVNADEQPVIKLDDNSYNRGEATDDTINDALTAHTQQDEEKGRNNDFTTEPPASPPNDTAVTSDPLTIPENRKRIDVSETDREIDRHRTLSNIEHPDANIVAEEVANAQEVGITDQPDGQKVEDSTRPAVDKAYIAPDKRRDIVSLMQIIYCALSEVLCWLLYFITCCTYKQNSEKNKTQQEDAQATPEEIAASPDLEQDQSSTTITDVRVTFGAEPGTHAPTQ